MQTHTFRVEFPSDLTQWQRLIQEGAHNSVSSAREIVISCRWREQDCKLTLHLDSGIQLMRIGTGGASSLLWSYPYERLKMSGDDGIRTLWLDFEDDGEQVRESILQFIFLSNSTHF